MTINYEFNAEQHYVLTEVIGQIRLTDALEYVDRLIGDPLLNKPFLEIVDFSKARDFDFGYYQSDQLMLKLKHLAGLNNYQGSILIAERDYITGMANVFRVTGEFMGIDIRVVDNLEEALNEVGEHFA
jgi:hypothetical protein|tara:strand:- start:7525 stop:7908 length:384 start_codon:yes stop_codon:yes gene_type:complete